MTVVVTDTGPLLHLHQAGAVHLLGHMGDVHTTPIVWRELQRHAPTFSTAGPPAWLRLCQPSSGAILKASEWVNARILDPGEAEGLAYALESKADLFLTDDAAATSLGESLSLEVHGSLGVVLHAAAEGHLDQASCLGTFANLEQRSTLWMSARVKIAVRDAIAEIFKQR
jgi:predicted nucleic acid-binding protein